MNLNITFVKIIIRLYVWLIFSFASCKKMIAIPDPINTITQSQTFNSSENATSALMGIYNNMTQTQRYSNYYITAYTALSSDEMKYFGANTPLDLPDLQPNDGFSNEFWNSPYFNIYQANFILEGIGKTETLKKNIKDQLVGEAKFIRAFCYFYLVNIFGDVPLITSTSWEVNSITSRTGIAKVYEQIIDDLKEAKELLSEDYSASAGERIRPNKYAAAALLARAYLYNGNFVDAEQESSFVIDNNALYELVGIKNVFTANNREAIWQLQPSFTQNAPYTTQEGAAFIPYDSTYNPTFYLTEHLLNAFEPGDMRRQEWVNYSNIGGALYYYPYKYRVRLGTQNVTPAEYTTVLRLGEQFLIRAEARSMQNKLDEAVADINIIRRRAGLADLSLLQMQDQVVALVAKERRIELFVEWGHRWLDLKRTGQADGVLGPIKQMWKTTAQLYPIPFSELQKDPNLRQNPGYN